MDNILRPRSRGSRGGVSPTRDGAVAMAPSFSRLQQKRDPESSQHRYTSSICSRIFLASGPLLANGGGEGTSAK